MHHPFQSQRIVNVTVTSGKLSIVILQSTIFTGELVPHKSLDFNKEKKSKKQAQHYSNTPLLSIADTPTCHFLVQRSRACREYPQDNQ
jgi:hypothetical protein